MMRVALEEKVQSTILVERFTKQVLRYPEIDIRSGIAQRLQLLKTHATDWGLAASA